MMSTIFGIRRFVNSMRAGTDIVPRIGPRTSPRKRMSRSPWNFATAIRVSELSQAGEVATSGATVASGV